jgi:hypothetical protein
VGLGDDTWHVVPEDRILVGCWRGQMGGNFIKPTGWSANWFAKNETTPIYMILSLPSKR